MSESLDYRAAGVDIAAGDEAKARLKKLVDSTRTAGTLGAFGAFGGLCRLWFALRSRLGPRR